jgi:hypothetical protein
MRSSTALALAAFLAAAPSQAAAPALDGLSVEASALPAGAAGDRAVRRLAERLVAADLLPQAAQLLQHQVRHRLEGPAAAQVAADLARVLLLDGQPQAALDALTATRTAVPPDVAAERRLLEAQALGALGRTAPALAMLEGDRSTEAAQARAGIAWEGGDWRTAGAALEGLLSDRWRKAPALDADEERRLLRAAIAYSLCGDTAALARLRARYNAHVEVAASRPALTLAMAAPSDMPTDPGVILAAAATVR